MVDFGKLANKAKEALSQHGDKVSGGIDKAAGFAKNKFKGKSETIDNVAEKAKNFVEGQGGADGPGQAGKSGGDGPGQAGKSGSHSEAPRHTSGSSGQSGPTPGPRPQSASHTEAPRHTSGSGEQSRPTPGRPGAQGASDKPGGGPKPGSPHEGHSPTGPSSS